jgi:heavy metal sensor kinase
MLVKSIRWRLQLWLGFLLLFILAGFGITAYQLHRNNQIDQIDEDLERHLVALAADTRLPMPPDMPKGGRFPFENHMDPGINFFGGGGPPDGPPDHMFSDPGRESRPQRRPGPNAMNSGPGSDPKGPGSKGGPSMGPRDWFEERFEKREITLSQKTLGLFDSATTNDFYHAVWSRRGNPLLQSTNLPPGVSLPSRETPVSSAIHMRNVGGRREAYQFSDIGECVLVGRDITADLEAIRRYAWLLVAAGSAVLALGLGGGWLLTSRALRPVDEISASASRISAGNLSERINVAEMDSELGRLAHVLNSTFARLEAAFAQQQQFTADASHELRTPLAVLISEAQTTLARERNAAEYRETLEACLETAQQMRRLTQSLLQLARLDAGQEPIERTPFDLAERVHACVELLRPLADQRGIDIECSLTSAPVQGDAGRLDQVITNLLSNAIHYNSDHGQIRVTTRMEQGAALLCVTDTGQGIAAGDLPHVFKRFYRADASRSRAEGRSGLGLAICKAIVDAHSGSIEVSSHPGEGTSFIVKLG